jgi:hypothetical protein
MCQVCDAEGVDYRFRNGEKSLMTMNILYKVLKNATLPIRLCYIHSLELFGLGERRFLLDHLTFARTLGKRSTISIEEESPFGH